jgi:hypothetical protein
MFSTRVVYEAKEKVSLASLFKGGGPSEAVGAVTMNDI